MTKILVGVLALVGCCFLMTHYAPSLWTNGIKIGDFLFRYAYAVIGGIAYAVYRLKE